MLDFGGVYGGYCVDLTRTVALGEPDAEMARVYEAVLEAQRAAIAAVKPGVRAGDIDAAAREHAGAGMDWRRPSGTARATAWAWKFTKRRGLDHDERRPATRRRRRMKRSSLEWSSPSSRAPISLGGAACGSKTTCW